MIGKLTGKVDVIEQDHLLLDVNGVGYQVYASKNTLSTLGVKGELVALYIDTHVREDAFLLYGFLQKSEQEWFRLLLSVQGVGAKAALSILTVCPPQSLLLAISAGDQLPIKKADGVGPKLATRILTELKDKVAKMSLGDFSSSPSLANGDDQASGSAKTNTSSSEEQISTGSTAHLQSASDIAALEQDAVSALVNLGYTRSDSYQAVMNVKQKSNDNISEDGEVQTRSVSHNLSTLIRDALKELSL